MARPDQRTQRLPQPHGCMSWSLAQAICSVGIPSYEIGLAAAAKRLVRISDGEGTIHFEWREDNLNRLPVKTLENLLLRLRVVSKESLQ